MITSCMLPCTCSPIQGWQGHRKGHTRTMEHYLFTCHACCSYGYLEPYIDARTVEIHWTKHTATYFKNLNEAIMPFPALQVPT